MFCTKARIAGAVFLTASAFFSTTPALAQLTQMEAEAWLAETCQPSSTSNGEYAIEVDEHGRALLTLSSPPPSGEQSIHCVVEYISNNVINFEFNTENSFVIGTYQISPVCDTYRQIDSESSGWENKSITQYCPIPPSGGRSFDVFVWHGTSVILNMDSFEELWPETFSGITIVASELGNAPIPETLLELSGPNPFRSTTRFSLELPEPVDARVAVYDLTGREVTVLAETRHSTGSHDLHWDASGLPSGTYLVRLTTSDGTSKIRLVTLMR